MTRRTGKNGVVKVSGYTVAYMTGWTLEYSPVIEEHDGAGMSYPAKYVKYVDYQGSFDCESDPLDTAQTLALNGTSSVTLVLDEDGNNSITLTAFVWGGKQAPRNGKITRRYSFVRAA